MAPFAILRARAGGEELALEILLVGLEQHGVGLGEAERLIGRQSQNFMHGDGEAVRAGDEIDVECADAARRHREARPFLALAQRLGRREGALHPFRLGEVGDDGEARPRIFRRRAERDAHRQHRAIGATKLEFAARRFRRREECGEALPLIGRDMVENAVADELRRRAPDHLAELAIAMQDRAVGRELDRTLAHLLEQPAAEMLGAFARRF